MFDTGICSDLVKWKSLSRIWLFETPWTVWSLEFSKPEYWSGQPFPSPGDLSNTGIEPRSPALQVDSLPAELQGTPTLLKSLMNSNFLLEYSFFTNIVLASSA